MKKGTKVFAAMMLGFTLMLTGCSNVNPNLVVEPTPTKSHTPSKPNTQVPTETPTTTPTPIPTPIVEPTKTVVIDIGADEVRIQNLQGKVSQQFEYYNYDDLQLAIEAFTDLYGKEPVKEYSGDDVCWYQMNTYVWDNLRLSFSDTLTPDDSRGGPSFIVSTHTVNTNYDRVVQSPDEAQIGFSFKKYLDKNPDAPQETPHPDYTEYQNMLSEISENWDGVNPEEVSGTLVNAVNDKITYIGAPHYLHEEC